MSQFGKDHLSAKPVFGNLAETTDRLEWLNERFLPCSRQRTSSPLTTRESRATHDHFTVSA